MQTQNNPQLEPFKAEHILDMKLAERSQIIFMIPGLLDAYETLEGSHTFRHEGRIFACGGVLKLWEGMGEAWFVLADDIDLPVFSVCAIVKDYVDSLIGTKYRRLQATIKCDDDKAIRFIEWLGFEREGFMRQYGVEGADYYIYARGTWQEQ
jgi:hypothetical protein